MENPGWDPQAARLGSAQPRPMSPVRPACCDTEWGWLGFPFTEQWQINMITMKFREFPAAFL